MSRPFAADVLKRGYQSVRLQNSLLQWASITEAAQNGALDIAGDFTIEAWINPRTLPTTNDGFAICGRWGGGQTAFVFVLYNNAGSQGVDAYISDDGTNYDRVGITYSFPVGSWSHLAVTCTVASPVASEFIFYIDGVEYTIGYTVYITGVPAVSTIYAATTEPFGLGTFGPGGMPFNGMMDDLRLWNDVRTASEIQDNMNVELVGDEANLVGYWKLNGDFQDSTANANHLIAAGTVLPVFKKDGGIDS